MALSNNKPLTYRPQSRPTDRLLILKKKMFFVMEMKVSRGHIISDYTFFVVMSTVYFSRVIKQLRALGCWICTEIITIGIINNTIFSFYTSLILNLVRLCCWRHQQIIIIKTSIIKSIEFFLFHNKQLLLRYLNINWVVSRCIVIRGDLLLRAQPNIYSFLFCSKTHNQLLFLRFLSISSNCFVLRIIC